MVLLPDYMEEHINYLPQLLSFQGLAIRFYNMVAANFYYLEQME